MSSHHFHLTDLAGFYPIRGIYYFISHPYLWPLFRARLLVIFLLSLFVAVNFFVWTYPPQWLFLRLFQGPSAGLNAVFLVLGETAAATAILFELFFVDETQVDIFDAVLIHEGREDLVSQGRVILAPPTLAGGASDPVREEQGRGQERGHKFVDSTLSRLGKPIGSAIYSPFSLRQIVEFIFFLPLNFIPYVGVPVFLILTGHRAGPLHHWRYFRLKNFNKQERKRFVQARKLRYTWFGTVGMILQLVPVLSMAFLCTTTVGSALWALRMEEQSEARREQEGQGGAAPGEQEAYTDEAV